MTRYNRNLGVSKWLARGILLVMLFISLLAPFLDAKDASAVNPPDSTPTVVKFNVWRNILETGDMLVFIYFNIPYATPPDEPIWQTYMWRLLKTDNVTEVGTSLPYAFNDNGYGYNLASMYFSAANVTAQGLTWGTAYPVRLSGNPAVFPTPPVYNFIINSGDYSTLTASADVKAEMAIRILAIATDLDMRWALTSAYSLLNQTETGTVLSIYGEAFFRGAVYGLQGLCPGVFAYVVSNMDLTERTFTDTYITVLKNQWTGTWVDTARNALDALFGTGYSLAWLIICGLACLFLAIINLVIVKDFWPGTIDSSTVAISFARLGLVDLGALAILAAVAVIYIPTKIWKVLG